MKNILILFLLIGCAAKQPALYGSNKTGNYVRAIDKSDFPMHKQWPGVLKRQHIVVNKSHKKDFDSVMKIQKDCNKFAWKYSDNWKTPLEANGVGDCKDAAICKYYKLRELGFEPHEMNGWSGWYGKDYQPHLTLAIRINGDAYILDNMSDDIIPADEYMRKVFEPYSRFNELGEEIG